MLEIDIEDVRSLDRSLVEAIEAVVINVQRCVGTILQSMNPPRLEIAVAHRNRVVEGRHGRQVGGQHRSHRLTFRRLEHVTLYLSLISRRRIQIETKASMEVMPAIRCPSWDCADRRLRIRVPAEGAPGCGGPGLSSVLSQASTFLRTRLCDDEPALCGLRTHGDDVDHAIHRVGAPSRATGPSDDFDSLDVFERHTDLVPVDAGKSR